MDNARQYGALQSTVWVVKVVFGVMAHFAGVCVGDNMTCPGLSKQGTQ